MEEAERGSKYLAGISRHSGSPRGGAASAIKYQGICSFIYSLAGALTGGGSISDRMTQSKFISTQVGFKHSPPPQSLTPSMSKSMTGGLNISMISQGGQQSSMIEREKRALEKIKLRQRKEVEQMMDYEVQMDIIRRTNEEKAQK